MLLHDVANIEGTFSFENIIILFLRIKIDSNFIFIRKTKQFRYKIHSNLPLPETKIINKSALMVLLSYASFLNKFIILFDENLICANANPSRIIYEIKIYNLL